MNRARKQWPTPANPRAKSASDRLGDVALWMLLLLVPLRALAGEAHTFEVARLFRHLDAPPTAQPATTFLINGWILLAAVLTWILRRRVAPLRWRWTGAEAGMALLIAAMIYSTWRAGQKHLALIGSVDFAGMLLLFLSLRQLLRRTWHVRLALVVVTATGAAVVVKCAYQKWVETPETIAYFEENRAELVGDAAPVDGSREAGFLHDYEQRLRSGAVSGYFSHPNVLASYLILIIFAALALWTDRRGRCPRWTRAGPGLLIAASLVALILSQSKGAAAAVALGAAIWMTGTIFHDTLRRNARAALGAVCLGGVALAVGLLVTLSAKPDALGRSMLFRSFYWRGASELIAEHPLAGVGANNFGRHFTRVKEAACPEDVDDPHSWAVKAAAEWGIPGLAGWLAMLIGVGWRMAVAVYRGPGQESASFGGVVAVRHGRAEAPEGGSIVLWAAAIGTAALTCWAFVIWEAPGTYLLVLHLPAVAWFAGFAAIGFESGGPRFSDAALGFVAPALCAGLLAFLVHSGIDLALFVGGPATTFFVLLAVALAAMEGANDRAADAPCPAGGGWIVAVVLGVGLAAVVTFALIVPSHQCSTGLGIGRAGAAISDPTESNRLLEIGYGNAAAVYRFDGAALDEWLEALERRVMTVADADEALDIARSLLDGDPVSGAGWQHVATLRFQRYVLGKDPADLEKSIAAASEAVASYPTSPNRLLVLAELLELKARATGAAHDRRAAAETLQAALDADERRIYISRPHRFTPERIAEIRTRIERIEKLGGGE